MKPSSNPVRVPSRLSKAWVLALALSAALCPADSQGADTASIAGRALHWLQPRRIDAGPLLGVAGSRFTATSQYAALIRPTSATGGFGQTLTWGGLLTLHWSHFTLSLAPRRETYSLATREETVAFPDNPFPHTLKAETELSYNVWPVSLGMAWYGSGHSVQAKVGAYAAILNSATIRWTVDGNQDYGLPPHSVKNSHSGLLLGVEYGVRMGPGTLAVGAETGRSTETLMSGMEGSLVASSAKVHLAYLWTLMVRRPFFMVCCNT